MTTADGVESDDELGEQADLTDLETLKKLVADYKNLRAWEKRLRTWEGEMQKWEGELDIREEKLDEQDAAVAQARAALYEVLRPSFAVFVRELDKTTKDASAAISREIAAAVEFAGQKLGAAGNDFAMTAQAALAQMEAGADAGRKHLDLGVERIGRASRRLAGWPLILGVAAAVAGIVAGLWAWATIAPDTTTVARSDGTTVTVLTDPDWAPCLEGLCRTTAVAETGG